MNDTFVRHAFYAGGAEGGAAGGAGGGGRWRGEHLFVVLCIGQGEREKSSSWISCIIVAK